MMHTCSKRLIAFVLLFSHTLMSCFNPPAAIDKSKLAHIAAKVHKKHPADLDDHQPIEVLSTSPFACTTTDGQFVTFTYVGGVWQAHIHQADDVERVDKVLVYLPVVLEPGYKLRDIASQHTKQQKQLVHLIPQEADLEGIGYVYIGREPITLHRKDEQLPYSPTSQQANTNSKAGNKPKIVLHQSLKEALVRETVSTAKKHALGAPSDKQSPVQGAPTYTAHQPTNKTTLSNEQEKGPASRNKAIGMLSQQNIITATQQAAKSERVEATQTEQKIELAEQEAIEQARVLQPRQELTFQYPAPTLEQLPIFIAKGGHRIQFTNSACQEAMVNESLPAPFSRSFRLRVIKESPTLHLQDLLGHHQAWHKNHIHIVFPEHGSDGQPYVYIGSVGLRAYYYPQIERVLLVK